MSFLASSPDLNTASISSGFFLGLRIDPIAFGSPGQSVPLSEWLLVCLTNSGKCSLLCPQDFSLQCVVLFPVWSETPISGIVSRLSCDVSLSKASWETELCSFLISSLTRTDGRLSMFISFSIRCTGELVTRIEIRFTLEFGFRMIEDSLRRECVVFESFPFETVVSCWGDIKSDLRCRHFSWILFLRSPAIFSRKSLTRMSSATSATIFCILSFSNLLLISALRKAFR